MYTYLRHQVQVHDAPAPARRVHGPRADGDRGGGDDLR